MNRLSIADFRKNMGEAFKQLPIELYDSKSKRVVAILSSAEAKLTPLTPAPKAPSFPSGVEKKLPWKIVGHFKPEGF